jgi:GntR family transcriptional regulator, transcriptional repressor for pyruvate dehydrogenase complex
MAVPSAACTDRFAPCRSPRYDRQAMSRLVDPGRFVRRDLVRAVLSMIADSPRPVGASVIHRRLLSDGYRLSEPTVSRLLVELDRLGFVLRHGRIGRAITPVGRAQLLELEHHRRRQEHVEAIVARVRSVTVHELTEVLAARRGLERETARAAATRATDRDLAALRRQYEALRKGESNDGLHELVARAAHSPLLESMYRVVTADPAIIAAAERLRSDRAGFAAAVRFNKRLLNALERRDPDAAERAVVDHLEDLLQAASAHDGTPRRTRRRAR